eukprot:5815468-Prymnesium_polylepis.1
MQRCPTLCTLAWQPGPIFLEITLKKDNFFGAPSASAVARDVLPGARARHAVKESANPGANQAQPAPAARQHADPAAAALQDG